MVARRLGADGDGHADRSGRVVSIIASLGALLVGAGLIYLIAYNWDGLTRPIKLAIVFATWLGLHVAGYHLARRPGNYPRLGTALTAAAVLAFGGAIALIAQIYNLSARYPWSVLLWWGLNLPLALLSGSVLILVVVAGLFLTWSFLHAAVYFDTLGTGWDTNEVLGLALLGLGLAALLAALGALSAGTPRPQFQSPLRWLARLVGLGSLYVLSFKDLYDWDFIWLLGPSGREWRENLPGLLLPFAVASAAAWFAIFAQRGPRTSTAPVWIALVGLALAVQIALWPAGGVLIANLLLVFVVIALVRNGTREGRASDINLALALFALCLVTRYFEFLWDKLEAAYTFMGLGILLLVGGFFLEKRRRVWIAASREPAP